jgi:hypothetical protein
MTKEEVEFSPVQPILFLVWGPAIYYFLTIPIDWVSLTRNWFDLFLIIVFVSFVWRNVRITILMLRRVPAIVLTDETITVAQKNYTLYWKDIKSVFLATSGLSYYRRRHIMLRVRDPEKCIKEIKNPIMRNFRWYTRNWSYSPFDINLFLVKGDDDEIYRLVLKYYQNNRGF